MIKSEIQEILNKINSITILSSDYKSEYYTILKRCVEKLQPLQKEDKNPMLETWLNMGMQEIQKELVERFKEDFENLSPERQKTEFLYSRSVVTMALINILMHL